MHGPGRQAVLLQGYNHSHLYKSWLGDEATPSPDLPSDPSPDDESPSPDLPSDPSPDEASPSPDLPSDPSPDEASPSPDLPSDPSPDDVSPSPDLPSEPSPDDVSPSPDLPSEPSPDDASPSPGMLPNPSPDDASPSPDLPSDPSPDDVSPSPDLPSDPLPDEASPSPGLLPNPSPDEASPSPDLPSDPSPDEASPSPDLPPDIPVDASPSPDLPSDPLPDEASPSPDLPSNPSPFPSSSPDMSPDPSPDLSPSPLLSPDLSPSASPDPSPSPSPSTSPNVALDPSPSPSVSPPPSPAPNCLPGFFFTATNTTCAACGTNFYCTGGEVPNTRTQCPDFTGTNSTTASTPEACVRLACQPCGFAAPDVYFSATNSGQNYNAGVYMVRGWTRTTADGSGIEVCRFNQTGAGRALFNCSDCAINDIAATNQGDLLVAGRRSATSGYLLKLILAEQVAGQPCKYTVLINNTGTVWNGLGAGPRSNLFYGVGGGASGGIFTVELAANGSANIVGVFPTTVVSSGAADITAAPDGKVYVVNSPNLVGTAYEVTVNPTTFAPTGLIGPIAANGTANGLPAAFCTSAQPIAASSSNFAYQFVPPADNGRFINIGRTGAGDGCTTGWYRWLITGWCRGTVLFTPSSQHMPTAGHAGQF
ncbi:hypothetical protein COO60DRAFT_1628811 [Scenedesmus sp. NREL 46B-D3]|nr:hypothetical protein COO60DRAFT_1628811 [Scenedesmus sp. NREL 46B-D3]